MSDRIAVMNAGRYEQLADPETLYERPKTRFVAGFLGVSNLLTGVVEGSADAYRVVRLTNDTRVRVPAAFVNGDANIEIGIRPEKIRLHEATGEVPPNCNTLDGVIRHASYMGVSTQYIVESRGGAEVTVYEQNVERATRSELWDPGEQVVMSWIPEHSFVIRADGPAAEGQPRT